jgi:hypothetical protein
MKRFFFNLASRDRNIYDTKGREFNDLAAAHRHAMLLIHRMTLLDHVDWRGWSVNIIDANKRSVLSVLFPQTSHLEDGNKTKRI